MPSGERAPREMRSDYPVFTPIQTRWMDNDVYGHVNNVTYYSYFDTAVNAWLIAEGLLDIDGDMIGLVVETGCRYFAPVAFPDRLEAGLVVSRIGTSSVTYKVGIFTAGDQGAAAAGHFTHVYVDATTRRPMALPDKWRNTLARISGGH